MGTRIELIYCNELNEFIETAVTEKEDVFILVNFEDKNISNYQAMKQKRRLIFDKYGVVYGKKMYRFEKINNILEEEFEILCKLLSRGYSKKESLSYARFKTEFEVTNYIEIPKEFEQLTKVCKYLKPCYIDGEVNETCRHKENIPSGSSRGECSRSCCPIYNK